MISSSLLAEPFLSSLGKQVVPSGCSRPLCRDDLAGCYPNCISVSPLLQFLDVLSSVLTLHVRAVEVLFYHESKHVLTRNNTAVNIYKFFS